MTDEMGTLARDARVIVDHNDKEIKTTARGEYWRMLVDGNYRVRDNNT